MGQSYNFGFGNTEIGDTLNSLSPTFIIYSKNHQKLMYVKLFSSSWWDIYASKGSRSMWSQLLLEQITKNA